MGTSTTLPQGVVPAFDMGCLPGFLTDRLVVFPEYALVCLPEVAVSVGSPVGIGDARPKLAATVRTPIAREPEHDLPGAAAERYPHTQQAQALQWTNDHSSSSSRTSSGWAGTKVVPRGGKLWAFF
ncbi:MAG TPA: hypothetical protein VIF37_09320 [Methylobacter sp.]